MTAKTNKRLFQIKGPSLNPSIYKPFEEGQIIIYFDIHLVNTSHNHVRVKLCTEYVWL